MPAPATSAPFGAIAAPAAALLLAGPTVLAFFSGGFFDVPRLIAALCAWALLALAAVAAPWPLLGRRSALVGVAGLALLAAWTGASIAWAPLHGDALDDFQRLLLYAAALPAASIWLRPPAARRAVEPALAAGVVAVALYALSERVLPGVVDLSASASARGRLEQPLTYWNALGILCSMGVVLCARVAGDAERPAALRAAACAGAVPPAVALYLTFSRGALGALAVGLIVLAALWPARAQLRALGAVAACSLAAVGVAALLPERPSAAQGLVLLAALVLLCAAAAALEWRFASAERHGRLRTGALRLGRPLRLAAGAAVLLAAVALVAAAVGERSAGLGRTGADPARLASLDSIRSAYWEVAVDGFAHHPLAGVGAAGFRSEWMRERTLPEPARDAHSLPIETALELGLVGLGLVGLFVAGVVAELVRLRRLDPAAAAGPAAALAAWAAAVVVDWHWEMPAVSLVALLLAGAVMAAPSLS